jgi:hypothetical protein
MAPACRNHEALARRPRDQWRADAAGCESTPTLPDKCGSSGRRAQHIGVLPFSWSWTTCDSLGETEQLPSSPHSLSSSCWRSPRLGRGRWPLSMRAGAAECMAPQPPDGKRPSGQSGERSNAKGACGRGSVPAGHVKMQCDRATWKQRYDGRRPARAESASAHAGR